MDSKRFLLTYVIEVRDEPVPATREIWATSAAQAEKELRKENQGIRLQVLSTEKL